MTELAPPVACPCGMMVTVEIPTPAWRDGKLVTLMPGDTMDYHDRTWLLPSVMAAIEELAVLLGGGCAALAPAIGALLNRTRVHMSDDCHADELVALATKIERLL